MSEANNAGTLLGGNEGDPAGTGGSGGAPGGGTPNPGAGGNGGGTPNPSAVKSWLDDLPEEIRGEASLKMIKDIPSLAKGYVNAQKLVGADKIPVPSKHATPEDWNGVFRKLGLPESVDKYELKAPEGVDPGMLGKFKETAFAANILPAQAEKIAGWFAEHSKTVVSQQEQAKAVQLQKDIDGLKTEWGQAYKQELAVANRALREFADEDTLNYLKETGLANDVRLVKLLNKVGKTLTEDSISGEGRESGVMTPAEAAQQITTIMGDKNHPYFVKSHPGHAAAVTEMANLFKMKGSKTS